MTTLTNQSTANVEPAQHAVVQHDTAINAAQAFVGTRKHIEQLVFEREIWEQNAYRTSNEQLYALLASCYQLYKLMEPSTGDAALLRQSVNDYINTKGLVFTKGTHTLAKIVKCVFGADRRRVSAYSIVLRHALAKGLSADQIPSFIRDNGGVEEIRLHKAANAMTPKQKAEQARAAVAANNYGVLESKKLQEMVQGDVGKRGKHVVLIGTFDDDGNVVVNAAIESDGVLNAALASYYGGNKDAVQEFAAQQKVQQRNQATGDAINDALANLAA